MSKSIFRQKVCEELTRKYPPSDRFIHVPTDFLLKEIDKWYEGTVVEGAPLSEIPRRVDFAASQIRFDLKEHDVLFDVMVREKQMPVENIVEAKHSPPKDALFLMYALYNRERRESLMGDMEQDFHEAVALWNPRKAAWLCRIGVLRSLWPSIIAWAARGAVFSKLVEWFHKFAG